MNKSKSNYFRKYRHHEGFIPILNDLFNEYLINVDGEIVDLNYNPIPRLLGTDGEFYVEIRLRSIGNILNEYKISHLVLHTFKPTHLPLDQLSYIDVLYIDGDKTHLHPSNLVWHWTKLLWRKDRRFAIIPGASNYAISKEGIVVKLRNEKIIKSYVSDGYACVSIFPDVGKRIKARIHRLKYLAWKDYPANVDDLEINHNDTNKLNNDLDNLELITNQENHTHANQFGLGGGTTPIPVSVRFISITHHAMTVHAVKQFKSFIACADYFKVTDITIRRRANANNGLLYVDLNEDPSTLDTLHGVQFKIDDDSIPWSDPALDSNPYENSQVAEPVKYRDIVTGAIKLSKSSKRLSEELNVPYSAICYILCNDLKRPVKQYEIKYLTDRRPWLSYTSDQIEIYRNMVESNQFTRGGYGYKCIHRVTGLTQLFCNVKDIASFLKIRPQNVNKKVLFNRKEGNWVIENIPLIGF